MKIIFASTSSFSLPCLEAIINSYHKLIAVYTKPDKKVGRGRKLKYSDIKLWTIQHNIPIYQQDDFSSIEYEIKLQKLDPDIIITMSYGVILPKNILLIPRFGCINIHASILPKWRGPAPIQYALLHGDRESGISIIQINENIDSGDILIAKSCKILLQDNLYSLQKKLSYLAVKPLLSILNKYDNNEIIIKNKQNHCLATYTKKINKKDAIINWNTSAYDIYNKIRAFNPWPIAYTMLNREIIRIYNAYIVNIYCNYHIPGTIIKVDKNGILVASKDRAIMIDTFQYPGRKIMPAYNLHAYSSKIYSGLIFSNLNIDANK